MRLLVDAEISDEIIGFHAQQAVEKWLKAVLGVSGNRVRSAVSFTAAWHCTRTARRAGGCEPCLEFDFKRSSH